jgi:hypothetical protein
MAYLCLLVVEEALQRLHLDNPRDLCRSDRANKSIPHRSGTQILGTNVSHKRRKLETHNNEHALGAEKDSKRGKDGVRSAETQYTFQKAARVASR